MNIEDYFEEVSKSTGAKICIETPNEWDEIFIFKDKYINIESTYLGIDNNISFRLSFHNQNFGFVPDKKKLMDFMIDIEKKGAAAILYTIEDDLYHLMIGEIRFKAEIEEYNSLCVALNAFKLFYNKHSLGGLNTTVFSSN